MPKCPNNHDRPPGEIFCRICGIKINLVEAPPEPTPEDIQVLEEKIQALKEDAFKKDEEIKALDARLQEVTAERDKLAEKHPEVEDILRQLDEKDREVRDTKQELDRLREQLHVTIIPPDSKSRMVIEADPIANPALGLSLSDQQTSLDLSATGFRIRANLEREADGSVALVIHPGATINMKKSGERFRKLEGGARVAAEPGMILFDPKGVARARLDWSI